MMGIFPVLAIISSLLCFLIETSMVPYLAAINVLCAGLSFGADDDAKAKSFGILSPLGVLVAGFIFASIAIIPTMMLIVVIYLISIFSFNSKENKVVLYSGIILTSFLAICSPAYLSGSATSAPLDLRGASRIVVFGDSLSAGIPNDNVRNLWPEIVSDELGLELSNLAYPGDTAGDSWRRWESAVQSGDWGTGSEEWNPDFAIVLLGGNNMLRKEAPEKAFEELDVILDNVAPRVKTVLLISVPGGILGDEYSSIWDDLASQHENVYIMNSRALRGIFTDRRMTVDGIHMNQQGHNTFAQKVLERIR